MLFDFNDIPSICPEWGWWNYPRLAPMFEERSETCVAFDQLEGSPLHQWEAGTTAQSWRKAKCQKSWKPDVLSAGGDADCEIRHIFLRLNLTAFSFWSDSFTGCFTAFHILWSCGYFALSSGKQLHNNSEIQIGKATNHCCFISVKLFWKLFFLHSPTISWQLQT